MSIIKRWLGQPTQAEEKRSSLESYLLSGMAGSYTTAGVAVNEENSLRNTAVLAAVRILSNSVAMLPLPVYQRIQPKGKERATDHPLYPILQDQANPEMTAFELRRWIMQNVLLYGNGYAEIEWSGSGEIMALWPLISAQMEPERRNGALVYKYTLPSGSTALLPAYRVLHLRGMTGNGVVGFSVVRSLMNEAIGLGLATQEYGARFFGNGARPGIVLTHPGQLSDKAYANLQASWSNNHEGLSNAHRLRILEEGMTVAPISVPPEEAQFLETRKFQVTEIARAFGVPPHLIADMEQATFSNIEHQYMEFLQFSLGPWLKQIEQTIQAQLMRPEERKEFFVEHVRDAILQADTTTRYQAYATARQWGWMSVNDIRANENMNPVEHGDEYLVPLNMRDAATPIAPPEAKAPVEQAPTQPAPAPEKKSVREVSPLLQPFIDDLAQRIAKRHLADTKRAGTKAETEAWQAEHWADLESAAETMAQPLLRAAAVDGPIGSPLISTMKMAGLDEAELVATIGTVLRDHCEVEDGTQINSGNL